MSGRIPKPTSIAGASSRNDRGASSSDPSPTNMPLSPSIQRLLVSTSGPGSPSGGDGSVLDSSAPTSLFSDALPRSLLGVQQIESELGSGTPRPRRLWTIQDTSVKPYPKFYPPPNPNCSVTVDDGSSPSVIAIRISECCRKHSISVEYDDESISAAAMTVDRCQFTIQLWATKGAESSSLEFLPRGVIVECIRIAGNTISFHAACRAILNTAQGFSTGLEDDVVRRRRQSGLEFGTLLGYYPHQHYPQRGGSSPQSSSPLSSKSGPSKSLSSKAELALEHARELLKKDRWDTQLLGMECLANLTCPLISGEPLALAASQLIIQQGDWLIPYVKLDESDLDMNVHEDSSSSTRSFLTGCTTSLLDGHHHSSSSFSSFKNKQDNRTTNIHEGRHESRLRITAIRVLCNSLSTTNEAKLLPSLLSNQLSSTSGRNKTSSFSWLDRQLLQSLVQDLQGANRPPSVVDAGYKLASPHEAALSLRCLRLLGESSATAMSFLQSDQVLERLEVARACGRITHLVLQQESERAYTKLTEDVRSC